MLAGGALLGDVFPFSRFTMYAGVAERHEGARMEVLADGQPTRLQDWTAFAGLDPDALLPPGVPDSQAAALDDARRWITAHPGPGAGPGVELVVQWRMVPSGEVREAARGRAWRE